MNSNNICTIVKQNEIAQHIFELVFKGDIVEGMYNPGQFVHVKVSQHIAPLLRRPLSIAHIDREKKECTLIYRKQGKGTQILAERKAGEMIDILGPLGHGFPISHIGEGMVALLVGGGIGIPPLYELSKQLVEKGVKVVHVLGFQNKQTIFYEEKFQRLGETYITTDDGSYGYKGLVTELIVTKQLTYDVAYACGPHPMLKALTRIIKPGSLYISLEERMGCGIGACYACVCKTNSKYAGKQYVKVCSDGPVFLAEEVQL